MNERNEEVGAGRRGDPWRRVASSREGEPEATRAPRTMIGFLVVAGATALLVVFGPALSPRARAGAPWARETLPTGSVRQTFRTQRTGLDSLVLAGSVHDAAARVHIRVEAAGTVLVERTLGLRDIRFVNGAFVVRFPPDESPAGTEVVVSLTTEPPGSVRFATGPPGGVEEGGLLVDGARLDATLWFEPGYRFSWRLAGLLSLGLTAALVPIVIRRGSLLGPLVIAAAVCVGAFALWQRDYRLIGEAHFFPDGYDEYARALQGVLVEPGADSWNRLREFVARYPHAHSPMVPLVLSITGLLGANLARAYAALSAVAAIASVAIIIRTAIDAGLSRRATCAAAILGATSFLFVRAAARTSTDMPGFLVIVAAIALALRLQRRPESRPRDVGVLVAILAAGAFVRPTVLPVAPALAFAGALCDRLATRSWHRLGTWLVVALLPGLLFAALSAVLGFGPSFAMARGKASVFSSSRTPLDFAVCLGVLVGLSPVLAILSFRPTAPFRARTVAPPTLAGLSVFGMSLAFLVVSGAPFWNRHFLPAWAGLSIATFEALRRAEGAYPRSFPWIVGGLVWPSIAVAAASLLSELVPWSLWYRLA